MNKIITTGMLFFINSFWMLMMAQNPLLSFKVGDKSFTISQQAVATGNTSTAGRLSVSYVEHLYHFGRKALVTFKNTSGDTLWLHNVVPFGESNKQVYITGKGKHGLSRTHLFRPGYEPVNVIVPDNAWELGFSAIETGEDLNVCALVRRNRNSIKNGRLHRFETELYPDGEVTYTFWTDNYRGGWQEGLRLMFQERMLYDVEPGTFDNSLLARKDLQWFRHTYVTHLMMTWDRRFYDYTDGESHLKEFLEKGKRLYGGTDVLGIWPTWPALGMDERSQWDMFRDLPGGFGGLRRMSDMCRAEGTRFFICYNPWDESARGGKSRHLEEMSTIIREVGVDGVVLDTKGESSRELQEAADRVRPGVIMYSEGMAVPRDMQGIPSGRVHNALYYPPMLNLVKFIKPDFAIFRVTELTHERVRREFAVSFFNGYGTELNIFSPGNPEWEDEQYLFLGQTVRILRENTSNFVNGRYTPLLPTLNDSIFVNRWDYAGKTIYTVFSLKPEGFNAPLFEMEKTDRHFIDIFNHIELFPAERNGKYYIPVKTAAFDRSDLGTNNEGAVCAIAALPGILKTQLNGDELSFSSLDGDKIRIWAGMPSYDKEYKEYGVDRQTIRLLETFPHFEGKFIIQAFKDDELLDERIVYIKPGTARMASRKEQTPATAKVPKGMVEIPAGIFACGNYRFGDSFIPYPAPLTHPGEEVQMPRYFMDKYPVTNAEFKVFMDATGYQPIDTANFLKHWENGRIPVVGQENFPVTYVAYEDAQAYAKWAGKRLPTEIEWQYAAQTSAGNEWPWKQKTPVKRIEEPITNTLSVWKLEGVEKGRCNTGDGSLYAVGSYPEGVNPYGLHDLVGCVWQLTNDLYDNATYRYIMMKGGSYFLPSSSCWYVQGGPRELNYRQYLLRVSQGFERNAAVGFRCVKDAIR
ncbi:MAG: formylglycine-generating enzyme family protein [Dysgonamonadaceae bacterium]|jgi:formylglycine-generating enzyme required for sulfatase activity|nr:formylglycine-generating enzyme family protein [Dysgonamonadaceae bacterium]